MRAPLLRITPVLSLVFTTCTQPPAGNTFKHPPLDMKMAHDLAEALPAVAPELRPVVAARGLAELERGRLGDALLGALDGYAAADASQRSLRIAAGLDSAEARAGWQHTCKTSLDELFQELAVVAPVDRLPLIRGACDPARFEQLGVAASARVDPMALALALVVHGAIERGASLSEAERAALTALATTPEEPPRPIAPAATP